MGFLDEGNSRWETVAQSGSGSAQITGATEDNLLVVLSKAPTDKYKAAKLTTAATDNFHGVTAGADDFDSQDPYDKANHKLLRVKTSEKLRVRTATAYVSANYGKGVAADATSGQEGWGTVAATGGKGFIVDGETIGTAHYLDFWMEESDRL